MLYSIRHLTSLVSTSHFALFVSLMPIQHHYLIGSFTLFLVRIERETSSREKRKDEKEQNRRELMFEIKTILFIGSPFMLTADAILTYIFPFIFISNCASSSSWCSHWCSRLLESFDALHLSIHSTHISLPCTHELVEMRADQSNNNFATSEQSIEKIYAVCRLVENHIHWQPFIWSDHFVTDVTVY